MVTPTSIHRLHHPSTARSPPRLNRITRLPIVCHASPEHRRGTSSPPPATSPPAATSPPSATSPWRLTTAALLSAAATTAVAVATAAVLAAPLAAFPPSAHADSSTFSIQVAPRDEEDEYFETVPQALAAGDDDDRAAAPRLGALVEGKRGKEISLCAKKCVPTCIRGGQGSPGLGPFSVRREEGGVIFKDGYRTRSYCLSECVQICNLELGGKPAAAQEPKK